MAEVDINDVLEEASKKKKLAGGIETKTINGVTYFKGPALDAWYDNQGEMLKANETAKRISDFKEKGLNEHGQTPEQIESQKKRAELLKQKASILERLSEIEKKISSDLSDIKSGKKEKSIKRKKSV